MRKAWRWLLPVLIVAVALAWWLRPARNTLDITALAKPAGAPADSLSARVIAQGDLPAPGTRSLFDHLLAQNDGLPYPFEKLVAPPPMAISVSWTFSQLPCINAWAS